MSLVKHVPQDSSDKILDLIKSSNLHFNIQETPHSVYITIRKKFLREPSLEVSSQVIGDQKLASLQNSYSNLKHNFEEEIDHHRESQNLIKLLEDKLAETEAMFIRECNKFKAEKETFDHKIKLLEDSNKAFKVYTKVKAEKPIDPPAKLEKADENSNELNESDKHQDPDENQNNFIPNIPVKNKFQTLSNLDGISTLSSPSTTASSSSQSLSRTPPSASSKLYIGTTPPLQDKDQLALSFRNFLEDFKDDAGDFKYVKIAKEMIAYNRNELQIQIEDILKHNQFLSEKISSDYYGMYNHLTSAFKIFMEENVDSSSGKKYFFLINLNQESKKAKIM